MQAIQSLLARLFPKNNEGSNETGPSENSLLPTEGEKNNLNVVQSIKEKPMGVNDGTILKELSNSDDDSDSSVEILEVRSFDSDEELRVLRSNYKDPKPFNLLEAIQNSVQGESSEPILKKKTLNNRFETVSNINSFAENSIPNEKSATFAPLESKSFENQPRNLDSDRESQHEKDSAVPNTNANVPEGENGIIEYKHETQSAGKVDLNPKLVSSDDEEDFSDLDMIDKIEESLINKHILKPIEQSEKPNAISGALENIMDNTNNKKLITFEEENITSEDETDQIKEEKVIPPKIKDDESTIDLQSNLVIKKQESEVDEAPQKNLLQIIEEVITPGLTPEVLQPKSTDNEVENKNGSPESLKSKKEQIGENEKAIDEPSKFIFQKAQTPYLNTNEINSIIDTKEEISDSKRKATEDGDELQEKTENLYSNPLLNGFFGQKKNKLKKRKVYVASEIKTFDSSLFTKEEDELIKEYVRRNPHLKNSHSLYDHIAKTLKNHTGNSIRRRFFNKLEKEIDFYYAVDDETGELVYDSAGNAVVRNGSPETQKSKFTAEEDYSISLLLKCHFYLSLNPDTEGTIDRYDIEALDKIEKEYYETNLIPDGMNNLSDKNIVPSNSDIQCCNNGKVVDWNPDFAQFRCNGTSGPLRKEILQRLVIRFPNHSMKSWRERYNKFLKPYGIDRFIYYYNKCRILKIDAEPITGLTSANNRARLLKLSNEIPESISLADLEMKFTRRRV